jgi:fatty acid desaturase
MARSHRTRMAADCNAASLKPICGAGPTPGMASTAECAVATHPRSIPPREIVAIYQTIIVCLCLVAMVGLAFAGVSTWWLPIIPVVMVLL